jgi:(hydroxyamino)benzene mutase
MANLTQRRLYLFGMALFLIGLVTGLANPAFKNPRMGLSAHLEGVMNGMFLIIVGVIWDRFQLSERKKTFTFWLLIWGTYVNWLACVLAGIAGASRMTPIAGHGFTADAWQEMLIGGMFVSVGLTMTLAVALLAWGLRIPAKKRN